MHVPDLADLEALRAQAEAVLKPEKGQRVLIIVASDKEAADMFQAPEDDRRANVVPLHGGPVLSGEEDRAADRQETVDLLLHYAELAEAGEVRHVAIVAGCETNETCLGNVQTALSPGLEDHMALFLGGCDLLKDHIKDVYEETTFGYEDEE